MSCRDFKIPFGNITENFYFLFFRYFGFQLDYVPSNILTDEEIVSGITA